MARVSVSNIAWQRRDEEVAPLLAGAGASGLEIAPTVIWDDPTVISSDDVRAWRRPFDAEGLSVVAMQSLLFGTSGLELFGPPEARAALREHLVAMCRVAELVGAGVMVFGSPRNRRRGHLDLDVADAIAAEFFGDVAEHAAEHGTVLGLEANPEDYGADYLTRACEARSLVETVDHPGLRLHLDAACMLLAGDDPNEEVRAGSHLLGHVHVSEPNLGTVGGEPPSAHHRAFAQALRDVGYEGFVSVEMRPDGDPPSLDRVGHAARFAHEVYG